MHTFNETGAGVPAFLAKLWRLVEDPETNNLICWSKDGRSFIIQNQAQFARELLPLNYKHNNMASFIRQLNMYGFHKITSIDNGGLKFDRDEMEFTHPCFKRNCPYLLEHIKRKIASTKSVDEKSSLKPEAVTKVLQDVKAMRGRQDSLDSRFSVMKQENEALWREIASLRQKHAKQQQIVNKLIQFLITIVQPQRNMTSVKRHMQLMINDIPENSKTRKTSESGSDCGPVIRELGEELLDEVSEVDSELMTTNEPFIRVATPNTDTEAAPHSPHNTERPHSSVSIISQNYDYSNQSIEDVCGYLSPGATVAASNDALIQTENNEGSKIFFHITEVPDAHPQETNINLDTFNEDNVLTTPMVREQMARSQLLKEKNRQRRNKMEMITENVETDEPTKVKTQRLITRQQTSPRQQKKLASEISQPLKIKSEQDDTIDPMLFLNVYPDNHAITPDPHLISPNVSEDSRQSNSNTTGSILVNTQSSSKNIAATDTGILGGSSSDLYNPNSFITNDIPADIFEDSSLMAACKNSNICENENLKVSQQEKFGRSTVDSGTFSKYLSGTENNVHPSTSAAAASAVISSTDNNNTQKSITTSLSESKNYTLNDDGKNMALTKYRNSQDVLRDEVSGHLDVVQDELENLKDLLRSDVYSLDHNTLTGMPLSGISCIQDSKLNMFENNNRIYLPPAMEEDIINKLFNDSEILGPYGLHLPNESSDDKKGLEIMAYQPMYDLSDIINDQNVLDAEVNMPTTSTLRSKHEYNNSVLNTPHHE